MSVRIEWDNPEQTVLLAHYEGHWTWEEFYQAAKECQVLSATVPHKVYIIANMVNGVMPQGEPFGYNKEETGHLSAKIGFVVMVSGSRFIQLLMNISARMIPKWRGKYHAAATIEEARAFIENDMRNQLSSTSV
jgi:hypothetical protein